jgi:hypothetical protein
MESGAYRTVIILKYRNGIVSTIPSKRPFQPMTTPEQPTPEQPTPEQRKHERVNFFLVPVEREMVPVWVFKPELDGQSHAGLILNHSESGMQVLTGVDDDVEGERFAFMLLVEESQSPAQFTGQARRVWSRPLGKLGNLSGFEFESGDSSAHAFLEEFAPSLEQRRWVRCLLQPIGEAGSNQPEA